MEELEAKLWRLFRNRHVVYVPISAITGKFIRLGEFPKVDDPFECYWSLRSDDEINSYIEKIREKKCLDG